MVLLEVNGLLVLDLELCLSFLTPFSKGFQINSGQLWVTKMNRKFKLPNKTIQTFSSSEDEDRKLWLINSVKRLWCKLKYKG